VSELSETAAHVLRSLREQPTLNTPSLIVTGDAVPEGVDKAEVERALDELVAAGYVKHRATGWKIAPGAG
jgi:DNA-binding MarR family transcriptional regulator